MGQDPTERVGGKRWLDRAEEMLALAQLAHGETKAQMQQLAASWLLIAAREDERKRPRDDFRSAD